jgi:hypothetical protein
MRSAVIAAVVAALVSASGTYAASQWVITKITQIRPGVLAQIRSKAGATGPAGSSIVGPEGKQGAPGIGESIAGPPGLQGTPGPRGANGVGGERGQEGQEGPRGGSGSAFQQVREYEGTAVSLAPGEHKDEGLEAGCPEGSRPVGGGYEASEATINVYASQPSGDTGWTVSAINTSTVSEGTVRVTVECAE